MKQIGLFGGSFDPVHQGHLLVAQAAREELQLDRLFFIPAARSPFKPESQPAPARERLRRVLSMVLEENLSAHDFAFDGWASHEQSIAIRVHRVYQYRWRYIRSLFVELRDEEKDHVSLVRKTIAALPPDAAQEWEEDEDELPAL